MESTASDVDTLVIDIEKLGFAETLDLLEGGNAILAGAIRRIIAAAEHESVAEFQNYV